MMRLFTIVVLTCLGLCIAMTSPPAAAEKLKVPVTELVAPLEGKPKYPFTRNESINCGRWGKNSQDYPYFGAPRDHNRRNHAGVDLYPRGGAGSPVKALADGIVIRIAPFYTRANGEVTYGILVDHGDFVANYAELRKPDIALSAVITQGQTIGSISGTQQLHLELYTKGTNDWLRWYGRQPDNLIDPTDILVELLKR